MEKIYPSHVLEDALNERGLPYTVCWEMKGPKNTSCAWMHAIALNGFIIIIQTFDDGGWNAYTPCASAKIDATIEDVLSRCRVKEGV